MATRFVRAAAVASLAIAATFAYAQGAGLKPMHVTPEQLVWTQNPNGTQQAKAIGDPTQAGLYALKVKFGQGLKLLPHFHRDDRVVTLVSGTMYLGYGDTWDESKMVKMTLGAVWTEPAGVAHYGWAKDGEAMLYLVAVGPTGTTAVPQKP